MLEGSNVAVGDVDPEDVSQQVQVAVSHRCRISAECSCPVILTNSLATLYSAKLMEHLLTLYVRYPFNIVIQEFDTNRFIRLFISLIQEILSLVDSISPKIEYCWPLSGTEGLLVLISSSKTRNLGHQFCLLVLSYVK